MKKLLKSFLIATASIGIIAGSTAAVISCGEKAPDKPTTPTQEDYKKQVAIVMGDVGTTTAPIQLETGDHQDLIQTKIATAINTYINAHTSTLTLLSATVDKTNVTLTGSGPSTAAPGDVQNSVTVTIPKATGATGVTPEPSQPTTMNFHVTLAPSDDYKGALNAIIAHFSGSSGVDLFSAIASQMSKPDTIKGLIQTSIFAYIGLPSSTAGALTDAQKAALKSDLAATDIVVSFHGTLPATPGPQVTDGTNNISVDIPAATGGGSKDTVLTLAKYTIIANADPTIQKAYDDAIDNVYKLYDACLYTETYLANWFFRDPSYGHPAGFAAGATYNSDQFNTIINGTEGWSVWIRNNYSILIDDSKHANLDALVAALDNYTTSKVFGALTITLNEKTFTASWPGVYNLTFSFAAGQSGVISKTFVKGFLIEK